MKTWSHEFEFCCCKNAKAKSKNKSAKASVFFPIRAHFLPVTYFAIRSTFFFIKYPKYFQLRVQVKNSGRYFQLRVQVKNSGRYFQFASNIPNIFNWKSSRWKEILGDILSKSSQQSWARQIRTFLKVWEWLKGNLKTLNNISLSFWLTSWTWCYEGGWNETKGF